MSGTLRDKLLEEMGSRNPSTTYTALEVLWGHVLGTDHKLTFWKSGGDVHFGCHHCVVTCIVGEKYLEEDCREVLTGRGRELIDYMNTGRDFRVKYFGVRTRFERLL